MSTKVSRIIRLANVPLARHKPNISFQDARSYSSKDADLNKEAKTQVINDISSNVLPLASLLCPEGSDVSTLYDSRKYSHELPKQTVKPDFDTIRGMPSGIFRCTEGETLGIIGAMKGMCYQNPEYFSFHHMTYYDMNIYLHRYRKPVPNFNRKPI